MGSGRKIRGGADFLSHTVETTPPLSVDGDIVEFDGASGTKIKDGGLTHTNVADAISKKHTQNADQYLDYGGVNQVSAADLHTTVDAQVDLEAKKHSQNTDQYIDYGGANQKSAAQIKAAHDHISNTANPHSTTAAQVAAIATAAGTLNALTEKTSLDDDDVFILEDSGASYAQKKVKKSNIITSSASGNPANLTTLLRPSIKGGIQEIVKGGFEPFWFNQQWGSAPMYDNLVDGATGVAYTFQAATGYIEWGTSATFGYDNTYSYLEQGLKISKDMTVAALWVRFKKVANPTANAQLSIYDDNAGSPNAAIANGAATAIAGTLITSDTNGDWYRFVFSSPPSLTANTLYHLVLSSSSNSTTNYFACCARATGNYPHGAAQKGSNVPAWSAYSGIGDLVFMVEPTSTYQPLQSGGQFDSKWVFSEGSPLDQSPAWTRPLEGMWNGNEFCFYGLWEACTKDRTILDAVYGLDHDRINLKVNVTTGYASLNVYETDKTLTSVTATATDLSTGTHAIGGIIRAKNDGSDYIKLYIDGTWYTSTGLSLEFDKLFRVLGNMTLGGGWRLAPAWTFETLMGTIPSGDGWTYNGTATEAAHAVVSGGKLFIQIVGSTDVCIWYREPTWDNANGSTFTYKLKIPKGLNAVGDYTIWLSHIDGTKKLWLQHHEYWDEVSYDEGSSFTQKVQSDNKNNEQCFLVADKGSDYLVVKNGKVIQDGTRLFTASAGGANRLIFGDGDATASYNSESVWDYIKGYTGSSMYPEFTSGSLHEFAFWSGDASALFDTLYNSGTFQSIKTICGIQQNYIYAGERKIHKVGLTSSPTTASTSMVLIPEMEGFIYGSDIDIQLMVNGYNSSTNKFWTQAVLDRKERGTNYASNASIALTYNREDNWKVPFGLHKFEGLWRTDAGTNTAYGAYYREIIARAK